MQVTVFELVPPCLGEVHNNSVNALLEQAPELQPDPCKEITKEQEELEVLTDADQSTPNLSALESQSEPEPASTPLDTPVNQTTPSDSTKASIQNPLEHLEEKETESLSDEPTPINHPSLGSQVWRDLRGLFRFEGIPSPKYYADYIRCDILPETEQISLAEQRIEKCSLCIGEYRAHQSKSQANSTRWKEFEKSIKSRELQIATEREYIDLLVSTHSGNERSRSGTLANFHTDAVAASEVFSTC